MKTDVRKTKKIVKTLKGGYDKYQTAVILGVKLSEVEDVLVRFNKSKEPLTQPLVLTDSEILDIYEMRKQKYSASTLRRLFNLPSNNALEFLIKYAIKLKANAKN